MVKISKQRWQAAQIAERKQHTYGFYEGIEHYRNSYKWYFHFLGIEMFQDGKSIIEIGPADFPALYYCEDFEGTIIEPMPSNVLETLCDIKGIKLIKEPVEEIELEKVDEIWLLNVMQHVIDPELFVSKVKESAKVIRYFEPVNTGITDYHPHSFTISDFERWFGNAIPYDRQDIEGFHEWTCAYGITK